MNDLTRKMALGLLALCLAAPVSAAEYLLNNPDFEEGPPCDGCGAFEIPGWFNLAAWTGGKAIIGSPSAGPHQGSNALRLSIIDPTTTNIVFAFQRLFINVMEISRRALEMNFMRQRVCLGRTCPPMII